MMKQLYTLVFLSFATVLLGQNVTVTGKAKNQPDHLVRVITYSDMFSNLESTVSSSRTDAAGDFSMSFEITQDQFAYLAIDLEKGEFYLSPSSSYVFNIPQDTTSNDYSVFDRLPLAFTLSADDGGLQSTIEEFNIVYNDFVYNNVNRIYRSKDKSVVREFVNSMNAKYINHDLPYVADYVYYTMAGLEWLGKVHNNSLILEKYIINQPVLYNNIQYCDFFKEFFKSYFGSEKTFRYEDLIPALNSKGSITGLYNLIERDTLIAKDNKVKELVAMLLMSRNYFDRYADKEAIDKKYEEIVNTTKFAENAKIARNFLTQLRHLLTNTPAPNFNLVSSKGDSLSIENLKGKFTLLSFVNDDCKVCQFHLKKLDELKEKLGFEIVTIVYGNSSDEFVNYAKERGYNWPVLMTGDNILLFEEYNVKVFPTYVFINPDGTIAYVHLPMPEENMEIYLVRFMERYNSRD